MTHVVCFTGDLKDKRNKVIPLEENPTSTTATLAPMNDETTFNWKQCWTRQHFPQLEDRHSSYSDVGLSGFSGCKLPSPHPFLFLHCQSKTVQGLNEIGSSGSSLTAAKTPQSCIKKRTNNSIFAPLSSWCRTALTARLCRNCSLHRPERHHHPQLSRSAPLPANRLQLQPANLFSCTLSIAP